MTHSSDTAGGHSPVQLTSQVCTEQPPHTRATFLSYEDLTEKPRESLSRLQSMLSIEPAFSETYSMHEFTGSSGDPGPNILSGRIGNASPLVHPNLPRDHIERAERAHAACIEAMASFALMPQNPE